MIKMIEDVECEAISGYGYANQNGVTETVTSLCELVSIETSGGNVAIYKKDITKLIKALTLTAKL